MCLTTNTPEILVAQEDITVYKLLENGIKKFLKKES